MSAADPTPAGTGPGEASEMKPRGPTIHDLKTWPVSYAAVASGRKCFELRKADRDFRAGDCLRLREYAMDGYTGDELLVGPVQYIAEVGAWVDVPEPFVVLGFPSHRAAPVAADARPADVDALAHALRHLPDVELHNDPVIIAADLLARVVLPSADARPEAGEPREKFYESFDARDWAMAFVAHVRGNPAIATDEGTMLGWFANALMRGWDERERRAAPPPGAASGTREPNWQALGHSAVEAAQAVIGQCDCIIDEDGHTKRNWYGARDAFLRAAVPPPSGDGTP